MQESDWKQTPLEKIPKKGSNIVLVGLAGSGKSYLGQLLAKQVGLGFVDLDRWIEKRQKKTVAQIFSRKGEAFFRKLEQKTLEEIDGIENHVIATGAGLVEDEQNRDFLHRLGTTVWLDCAPRIIAKRLLRNPHLLEERPLLASALQVSDDKQILYREVLTRLENLFEKRQEFYKESEVYISEGFSTTDESINKVVRLVEAQRKKGMRNNN